MSPEPLDHLEHLRTESARFGAALRDADPAARVPTCPDWDADDLLWHLAEVQLFWGAIVRERLDSPQASQALKPPRPTGHDGLVTVFDDASVALLETLTETAADVEVWTWSRDHSVGWIRRRMAQEALVHRLDAELTAGALTAVDTALAADGVDEALRFFFGGYPGWVTFTGDGPVGRVRTTDTGGEWLVRVGRIDGTDPRTGADVTEPAIELLEDGGPQPSFTVGGTARDVLAWLWNRPTVGEIATEGADVDRLRAVVATGIG